jgi:hypothetical protein
MRLVMDTDLHESAPSELMNDQLCTGSMPLNATTLYDVFREPRSNASCRGRGAQKV